ncbi:hypothetical protein OSB04_019411 [Centaurea solstitialis]|uniref:CCHC-type domain-containing protein n=1 Tax=Centaurea solstitialis TaxID=347529 RepID=A0AA38SQT4_9ASTR|nr:hypothetical protein OSB04_019411 [Centaurea solstitialis]
MYRYRGVLKMEIKEFVATAIKSFSVMVEVARAQELELEEQHQGKRKAKQEPVPVKKSKGQRSDGRKEFSGCPKCGKNHSGECRLPEPVCFKCGKPGHRSRECRVEPRTCFHCFQPGHIKPNCPYSSSSGTSFHSIDDHRRFDGQEKRVYYWRSWSSVSTDGRGDGNGFRCGCSVVACMSIWYLNCALFDLSVFPINKKSALVLFDTGATWSFVSSVFCKEFRLEQGRLARPLAIDIAAGEVRVCGDVYRGCSLVIHGVPFTFGLIPTPLDVSQPRCCRLCGTTSPHPKSEWGRAHRVRRRATETASGSIGRVSNGLGNRRRRCVRGIRNFSRIDFGDEILNLNWDRIVMG